MTFYYKSIESFVSVCHVLIMLDVNFHTSWRYIEKGRVEFIVDVELDDLNVL